MGRIDPAYIKGLSRERLEDELKWELERIFALRDAFKELPEIAPVEALHLLSLFATFPRDWERGKQLQREHGIEAVPPNSECESGAGLWALIREALVRPK